MNSTAQSFVRKITTSAIRRCAVEERPSKNFIKLKQTQQKFQVDDGVPVYLKKGASDKILYQLTAGLLAVGLGMSFKTMWDLSFGKYLSTK